MELPEDSSGEIEAFVSWVYTGYIETDTCAEKLWVLGDKLRSPAFCNDVMYLLFNTYGACPRSKNGQWISAATAQFVYENTLETSALRCFISDLIKSDGPFCKLAIKTQSDFEAFKMDWTRLLCQGGPIVLDITLQGSFCNHNDYVNSAYHFGNQHKYLVLVDSSRSVEGFVVWLKKASF